MPDNLRRGLLAIILCLLMAFLTGAVGKTKLKVFHAGSLSIPLKRVAEKFEAQNPNVDVQLESHGSVLAVRQITEVGKKGDVIAVADYTLIPSIMYPKYAKFYLQFARNRMVLVYTDKSKYSKSVNQCNWYNILRKNGVTFGFSNPNMDPCGYRSLMVLQLAELFYMDDVILDDLVLKKSAIGGDKINNKYRITTPEELRPNTKKLSIRPKEVALIPLIEAGGLDYAFEYISVAKQHGLKWVALPEQIDLSSTKYQDQYNRVEVRTSDGRIKVGKPIVYGISVPKNAPHPGLGINFIKFIIGKQSQEVFESLGQPPIVPPVGNGEIPAQLQQLIQAKR